MANRQQQQLDILTFLMKLLFCARGKLARKYRGYYCTCFPDVFRQLFEGFYG